MTISKETVRGSLFAVYYLLYSAKNLDHATLKHEAQAASKFVLDGLWATPFVPAPLPDDAPNAVILKGFGAPEFVYSPMRHFLEYSLGIRTFMPRFEWFDINHYVRSRTRLCEFFDDVEKNYGPIHFGVGHSLGGTEVVSFVDRITTKVVAIAGVFNGGAQWPIVALSEPYMPVPETLRQEILNIMMTQAYRASPDKIVTIAAEKDWLVPPDHAWLPMASNYVYSTSKDPSFRNSHTYLPNTDFVKDILRRELVVKNINSTHEVEFSY